MLLQHVSTLVLICQLYGRMRAQSGLPFEVDPVESCDTGLSLDTNSLTGVKRGEPTAPCAGYLQYTDNGATRRLCSHTRHFNDYAAQRACYTLGVNFYRNADTFLSMTRQMMLFRCFRYREQGVDSTEEGGAGLVFDINDDGATNSIETGCDVATTDADQFDCFDECHFEIDPVAGNEDDCTAGQPFWTLGCADINECVNGVRDYCKGPFFETSCTIRKACGNNTDCTNHVGSFECTCKNGFENKNGDALAPYVLDAGCVDVNECDRSPDVCGQAGECINTAGSYLCLCPTRALWDDDTKTCSGPTCGSPRVDPNAQLPETHGLPGETAVYTCEQGYTSPSGASYHSVCTGGTWFHNDFCTDVDECQSAQCDPNADCKNSPGSFSCHCHQGYTGDGRTCSKVPCDPLPEVPNADYDLGSDYYDYGADVTFTCKQGYHISLQNIPYSVVTSYGYSTHNLFTLKCNAAGHWLPYPVPLCLPIFCGDCGTVGYSIRSATGFLYNQEVKFKCEVGFHTAKKTLGTNSFVRKCQADGTWTEGTTCVDVNECEEDLDVCGGEGKYCINTVGSYMCSCVPWYEADQHDNQCVAWAGLVDFPDYKPCRIRESLGLCKHGTCEEVDGSAVCECNAGYSGAGCERPDIGPALIVAIAALVFISLLLLIQATECIWQRTHVHVPPARVPPPYLPPPKFGPMFEGPHHDGVFPRF